MLDPDRYHNSKPSELRARYIEVKCQLAGLTTQLHDTQIAERKTRSHAFNTSPPELSSVAARERYADDLSLTDWIAVKDIQAEIADLTHEEQLLLNLIAWCHDAL